MVVADVIKGFSATATVTCNGVSSEQLLINQDACSGDLTTKTTANTPSVEPQTYYTYV